MHSSIMCTLCDTKSFDGINYFIRSQDPPIILSSVFQNVVSGLVLSNPSIRLNRIADSESDPN